MSDPSIYRPYTRLVRVRIRDRWFEVPENNILLRCFQFLAPGVPYGPFCWNGDCENDRIRYRESGGAVKSGLACQVLVKDGMELDEISSELARVLDPAFETVASGGTDETAAASAAGGATAPPLRS
jgi:hypothetical protein